MAKMSGAALTTLDVDDSSGTARGIRNDITNWDFQIATNMQVVTGQDMSAEERLALLADFSINLNGVMNTAANRAHDVFKDIAGGVARTVTIGFGGVSLGTEVLFSNYSINRGTDASLVFTTAGSLADGTVPTYA